MNYMLITHELNIFKLAKYLAFITDHEWESHRNRKIYCLITQACFE